VVGFNFSDRNVHASWKALCLGDMFQKLAVPFGHSHCVQFWRHLYGRLIIYGLIYGPPVTKFHQGLEHKYRGLKYSLKITVKIICRTKLTFARLNLIPDVCLDFLTEMASNIVLTTDKIH
jgi:hypothetical protein